MKVFQCFKHSFFTGYPLGSGTEIVDTCQGGVKPEPQCFQSLQEVEERLQGASQGRLLVTLGQKPSNRAPFDRAPSRVSGKHCSGRMSPSGGYWNGS
jgi:hypothetical protein